MDCKQNEFERKRQSKHWFTDEKNNYNKGGKQMKKKRNKKTKQKSKEILGSIAFGLFWAVFFIIGF